MVQTNSLVRCATYLKTSKGKKNLKNYFILWHELAPEHPIS